MEIILEPWPWYVTGPLIGMMVPTMLWLGAKFGVSGNLESICNVMGAGKYSDYFRFDIKPRIPGMLFVFGAIIGGFLAGQFLTKDIYEMSLSTDAIEQLAAIGLSKPSGLQPTEIFYWKFLSTWQGIVMFCFGGFLIGFGTRYAGGCTSGHSITGLSAMRPASLIATIGFFIGGLLSTHLIIPLLLGK